MAHARSPGAPSNFPGPDAPGGHPPRDRVGQRRRDAAFRNGLWLTARKHLAKAFQLDPLFVLNVPRLMCVAPPHGVLRFLRRHMPFGRRPCLPLSSSLPSANPRQAVVICTRNQPADLERTLGSIADQRAGEALRTLVADASDKATRRRRLVAAQPAARHLPFPFAPSLPQQRSYGLDRLPDDTGVVHFVDDDVAGQEGYFRHLTRALRACPEAQGAGGLFTEPFAGAEDRAAPLRRVMRRLFLLASSTPGRVLPSGHAAPAQRVPGHSRRTQWLSGCASSYRRAVFDEMRFDPALSGYAMLEDLDFSYRVGQTWNLAAVPAARLVHRASPKNRYDAARFGRTRVIHRYWFVEKNLRHPLRKPAFWWSTAGRFLAVLTSDDKRKWAALRGLREGIHAVWRRDHPLLRTP